MATFRGAIGAAGLALIFVIAQAQAPTTTQPTPPLTPPAAPPAAAAPAPAPQNPPGQHPLTPTDLEAFFDGILPLQLERSDIAGASVLVMKDGNVLLEKGYGYADLKANKPVDPGTTIFRLASISKLFTWVAVMQLQEQGKLDLDTDVNRYLDFHIRPAFGKPITLRNLMTHTAGFEEFLDDLILFDPKKAGSLRDDLFHNQPMRMFPPGEIPAYSNYGVGLASYIVQRASGEPFQQYVQEHIFAPLEMTHSSFYQPLPKSLPGAVSEGYRDDTTKPPVGFEIVGPVGAGGVSSTAADMGRFGQALLNGGELDGKRILKPETVSAMWTPQFRASEQLPAQCMGFYQTWRNDLRWIGHEGDLIAFHSLFFVEPSQKLILFTSYNSSGGGGLPRPEIIESFSDRYFPGAGKQDFLKTPVNELKDIEGSYQTTRRADTTRLKLTNWRNQQVASVDRDGVLKAGFRDLRGHVIKWRPIGKDLWEEEGGQRRLFAIRDGNNHVVRLALDFPGVQMERVPLYEDKRFIVPLFYTSLAILILVVVASLARTGRRIFFHRRVKLQPQPGTIWLTFGPRFAAFSWVSIVVGIMVWQYATKDVLFVFTPGLFKWLTVLNWATGIALFWSIFAVLSGIRIWWRPHTRSITMIKFTIVALACLFASWFAVHWRLIGPAHRI